MPTRPTATRDQLTCRANSFLQRTSRTRSLAIVSTLDWTKRAIFPILNYTPMYEAASHTIEASGRALMAYDKRRGGTFVSIVRVGLAETKHFADGYDAIFGKGKGKTKKSPTAAKRILSKKKPARKK